MNIYYWLAVGKLYINGDHLCRSAVLQGELPRQLNFFVRDISQLTFAGEVD